MVLYAVVGHEGYFIDIKVSWFGKVHESTIWKSAVFLKMQDSCWFAWDASSISGDLAHSSFSVFMKLYIGPLNTDRIIAEVLWILVDLKFIGTASWLGWSLPGK